MPVRAATPTTGGPLRGTEPINNTGEMSDIDPNDPRVKKLVYSMYRDMLTSYNPQANKIIGEKDPRNVYIDNGITPILESIIRGGGSSAVSGGGGGEGEAPSAPAPPSLTGGSAGERGPPPPPPMAPPGALPPMRLNSEIGPRDKGPPAALGSAMMKDKKPFTYTPGGIDLSEIRSPRMAKRLQMNAQAEGVTSVPSLPANHPSHNLPPHVISAAALAQMQPQIAIPVFPQGPMQPSHLSRTPKPFDYTQAQASGAVPPPPPPPQAPQNLTPQPPKAQGPPAERPKTPVSLNSALNEAFAAQRGARVAQNAAMAVALQAQRDAESNPNTPPVAQVNEGHQHPLQGYTVTQARPQNQTQPTIQIVATPPAPAKSPQPQISPQEVTRRSVSPPVATNQGQGSIYIPPLSPPQNNTTNARPISPARQKAAALGSIYIPPVEQPQQQAPQRSVTQQQQQMRSPPPPPQVMNQATPPTPTQLNKAPTPWMNSYNKMVKQAESPPYVNPGNVVTPWGVMTPGPSGGGGGMSSPPPPPMGGGGNVRTIPISIQREFSEPNTPISPPGGGVYGGGVSPQGEFTNKATAAQHLGRVIPIQIQRQESVQQSGARNIPIQIEGRQGTAPVRRVAGPPTLTYNNPPGGNFGPPQELMGGMQNMSMGGPRMEPSQSKAMRVIQQAAENDVDNFWGEELRKWGPYEQPYRRMESMDNDNAFTFVVNHQVDNTEPRFRGGTIPSRAFKTLLSSLPPDADSSYPGGQQPPPPQQQQHMIQIRMTPMSPTPSTGFSAAASEQRTPEPRKYMGSSIPSRSFKMLQAMTDDADPDAVDAAASSASEVGGGGLSCSSSSSSCSDASCPSPLTFDPSSMTYLDPYSSYMSWYYWWYYLSCYWGGYDMTGVEIPEGWDPENPYWPPEWSTDGNESDVPSDVEPASTDARSLSDCDKKGGATTEEEESYWSCDDEHIKKEEEEEEEEETEGEDEDGEVVGVVEEPETPLSSAEDSDAPTLVDGWEEEPRQKGGVFIEEVDGSCSSLSTNSSDAELLGGGLRRLSTIDEVSTRNSSWSGGTPGGLIGDDRLRKELEELGGGDGGEEEDEESSEEESVIENKSGAALSESKREDWTTSSSSEEEEEEEEKEEEAVTFRLPLKLSFSKTKSYKDITTVLVGEVDEKEELKKMEEEEQKEEEQVEEEEEEEPVVSFTISLSRQTSKEEEPEVDFWGQITGKGEESKTNEKDQKANDYFEPVVDFWGSAGEGEETGKEEAEPVVVVLRKKPPLIRRGGEKQRPCSVGGGTKSSFNFWDKEVKSFETRRFSGNFEISEDYESDSGMKSDTCGSAEQKKRIKKFTRTAGQKRHSIPGLPISLRSFGRREEEEEAEEPEMEVKVEEPEAEEPEEEVKEIQPQTGVVKSETTDLSAGWSYWDDLENAGSKPTSPNFQVEDLEKEELEPEVREPEVEEPEEPEFEFEPEEPQPEIEEPESEEEYEEEYEGDVEVTVDLRLPTPKPTSSFSEISGQSEEFSDCAEGDEENEESEEEDYEEDPQPQEIILQKPPIPETPKIPEPAINLQQQNSTVEKHDDPQSSEESSSKSSGRTILPEAPTSISNVKKLAEDCQRPIEIQQISAAIKMEEKEQTPPKCPGGADSSSFCASNIQGASSNCTCHIGDRMARAESLLWRIERFLHESLSLGSEDDSGVMTDLSRQISDVDTDNDQPEGDTSTAGLLLATKDFMRTSSPLATRQKPRPKSEIICVESLANDITEELAKKSAVTSDVPVSNVKMRGTAAERKALRYQRAKTHSRLFQLLQDECGKEEDEEDDDEDPEEFLDCVETTSNIEASRMTSKTPVNLLETPQPPLPSVTTPIQVETSNEPISSTSERKSRLMPLPLRNTCGDGDSNSSASGSSGVLSPTSPVTRDQLLADIITEFHMRHQDTLPKTRRLRSEKFPSRIFKLLQSEFGEEFYETFDTLGTELRWLRGEEEENLSDLKTPLFKEKGEELIKECTIHKSESLKALEEAEQAKKTKSPDLLEVPLRRRLKGGSTVTRDFRSPKRK